MSVDPYLIVIAIVMPVLILFCVCLLVVVFGHPDDKLEGRKAWFPKVVTVSGLWLAFISVLILPYDIGNSRAASSEQVRADLLWQICYIAMAFMLFLIIPFSFFYYESELDAEEEKHLSCLQRQAGVAFKYTVVFTVCFVVILVIFYALLNTADIPVHSYTQSVATVGPINGAIRVCGGLPTAEYPLIPPDQCEEGQFTWNIPLTFPVYVMAFMSFIGWWFFALFVGVGLTALPMDLINEYRTRPKPMRTVTYFEEKRRLGERAKNLAELGDALKKRSRETDLGRQGKQKLRKSLREFEKHFYFLKQDYQLLIIAHKLKGGNPLIPVFKLVLGILSIGISFSWLIHIAIFILPARPAHQFLNMFFIKLASVADGQFPLFGVVAYGTWSLFLLVAVVKGNFKLGVRFLFWKVYPMEYNGTLMNSFLANTWVILLCSVPTVQFCVRAFPVYAANTEVLMMFGIQAQYVQFFKYFWANNAFVYVIIILAGLTFIYLLIWPNDQGAKIEKELEAIAKEKPTPREWATPVRAKSESKNKK